MIEWPDAVAAMAAMARRGLMMHSRNPRNVLQLSTKSPHSLLVWQYKALYVLLPPKLSTQISG